MGAHLWRKRRTHVNFPQPFYRWRPHPWHGPETGRNPPALVYAYTEITPFDYIHLNPLRAGLVSDLPSLARYPWCGHAVLLGYRELPGQQVEEVLVRFGSRKQEARQKYLEFMASGVVQGRREGLMGGGLGRSLAFLGRTTERESFD